MQPAGLRWPPPGRRPSLCHPIGGCAEGWSTAGSSTIIITVVPAVLLWDFGDTLVDEQWMRHAPAACPEWGDAWADVMRRYADDWNIGRHVASEIFAALADHAGMSVADVEAHAQDCCRRIEFNPTAWRVATERRLPQALVTVNPDIFARWIVPTYNLTATFDIIVMSFAEQTDDKTRLCDIALERLEFDDSRSRALLIDNRRDLVDAWQATGGAGYWFQNDERFEHDLALLLE